MRSGRARTCGSPCSSRSAKARRSGGRATAGSPGRDNARSLHPTGRMTMQGKMLWFNLDKGYGFINTEDGERLYVARSSFLPHHEPESRCKGREVTFHRQVDEGETRAVEV